MNRYAIAVAALSAFAACAACEALAAEAFDLPARKPGHWEIKMVTEIPAGGPETVIQLCIDAATDRQMMEQGLSLTSGICPKREMKREGDAILIDAECKMGPISTTSRTVITGDFQSAYTMKITGDVEGLPAGNAGNVGAQQTAMTQHARWISDACPAGLTPGDMKMPGGARINVKDMLDKLPATTR
jgi:hypothetical protein